MCSKMYFIFRVTLSIYSLSLFLCVWVNRRRGKTEIPTMWSASFQEIPLHLTAYLSSIWRWRGFIRSQTMIQYIFLSSFKNSRTKSWLTLSAMLTSDLHISFQKLFYLWNTALHLPSSLVMLCSCVFARFMNELVDQSLAEFPVSLVCVCVCGWMELPVKRCVISHAHTARLWGNLGKHPLL